MRDATQIAARLQELSLSHPGAGLAELACHVLALAGHTRRERDLIAEVESLGHAIAAMRREVARRPAEHRPAEQRPVEQRPAEHRPAEQRPVEQRPVEQRPAEQRPADEIAATHIPLATDELDAIVTHTAAATETILASCELLDALAATLPDAASRAVRGLTVRIYEACGFQDITGQRIARIVATLQAIEVTVGHMRGSFAAAPAVRTTPAVRTAPAAAGLLNGPQRPARAMAQADIDRLLAAT